MDEFEPGDIVRVKDSQRRWGENYEAWGLELEIKGRHPNFPGCYTFTNHYHRALPERIELVRKGNGPW